VCHTCTERTIEREGLVYGTRREFNCIGGMRLHGNV
jgi:uncharacterized protein (DUF169 family)